MANRLPFSMYKTDEELKEMEKTVETNSKKNLVIVPDGRYGLFVIKWDDGRNATPDILSGMYTSQTRAETAIKNYVSKHRTTKHKEKQERDRERDEKIRQGINYGKPSEETHDKEKEEEEQVEEVFS